METNENRLKLLEECLSVAMNLDENNLDIATFEDSKNKKVFCVLTEEHFLNLTGLEE